METLPSIDLRIADRLKVREFRREWFRAALEADVPEMFRDLREARDMTQSELAEESGMKQSAISRFEGSRDAKWKLETLLKLAEALDAKLEISVIPAEVIIERIAREEASGSSQSGSVVEASKDIDRGFNDVGWLTAISGSWKRTVHLTIDEAAGVDIELVGKWMEALGPFLQLRELGPFKLGQGPDMAANEKESASAAVMDKELAQRRINRGGPRLWS